MVDSAKLKARIVLAGYNQKTLSEATGICVNSINAKLNNRRPFNCDEVDTICKVLGINEAADKVDIFLS